MNRRPRRIAAGFVIWAGISAGPLFLGLGVVRRQARPPERVLLHGARQQQLVVRACFSDGRQRDVTRLACFEPNQEIVKITPGGLVTAQQSGLVTVVVRYLDQRVPSQLAFVLGARRGHWLLLPSRA